MLASTMLGSILVLYFIHRKQRSESIKTIRLVVGLCNVKQITLDIAEYSAIKIEAYLSKVKTVASVSLEF